jgi:short-subunit dehydrogenase
MIMQDPKDQLVVVTGGTKGIGRAVIERFSMEGYSIATCARNEDDLAGLKSEMEGRFANHVHVYQADVSKKDEVQSFIEFVNLIAKSVAVLVNNAGKFVPGQVHMEDDGILESQIETNLYSAYRMSRGIIPQMKQKKSGHIFNMASIASLIAYPNGGSYSISKFAMYGMSKALREELKEYNIRVTSVMPGATLTASWEGVDLPEERLMKPEDVAEMVYTTYKISDRSVVEDLVIRPQLGDL